MRWPATSPCRCTAAPSPPRRRIRYLAVRAASRHVAALLSSHPQTHSTPLAQVATQPLALVSLPFDGTLGARRGFQARLCRRRLVLSIDDGLERACVPPSKVRPHAFKVNSSALVAFCLQAAAKLPPAAPRVRWPAASPRRGTAAPSPPRRRIRCLAVRAASRHVAALSSHPQTHSTHWSSPMNPERPRIAALLDPDWELLPAVAVVAPGRPTWRELLRCCCCMRPPLLREEETRRRGEEERTRGQEVRRGEDRSERGGERRMEGEERGKRTSGEKKSVLPRARPHLLVPLPAGRDSHWTRPSIT